MTAIYRLNPFAIVSEAEDGFALCGSSRLRVKFAREQRPFIELLTSGQPFSRNDLGRYLAENRIEEMCRKHILLTDRVPPVTGRYSRQLGFFSLISADFESCQDKLAQSDILLLGAGAIGSHVLWHLAAMGAGKITLVDFDSVEETNLNRQLLYSVEDIGQSKVNVLCASIAKFNPGTGVIPVNQRICGPADIEKFLRGKTIVIKAIDTPEESTGWVNEVCVKHAIPFIAGGFIDDVGVVGPAYIPGKSVCHACFMSDPPKKLCGTAPTFAPLTGMVSSLIAMCAFRIIAGTSDTIANKLYTYDTFNDVWETVSLAATQTCKVCGREAAKKDQPARSRLSGVWGYRCAIVFLVILAGVVRSVTHDQYGGLIMVCMLFLSVPALDLICEKKPEETRRQIFFISCIYCLINLLIGGLNGSLRTVIWPKGWGLDALFDLIEQLSFTIMEAAIAITCLFFLLIMFMHVFKTASGERERWLS
jgi:molybdopterin/thiamine biosynthesis adenylyltransferase